MFSYSSKDFSVLCECAQSLSQLIWIKIFKCLIFRGGGGGEGRRGGVFGVTEKMLSKLTRMMTSFEVMMHVLVERREQILL